MRASCVIGGMNPRLGSITPEGRSERRLIDKQGCDAFASSLYLTLNWVLVLTLCSSWVNSNAIATVSAEFSVEPASKRIFLTT
jgi:hypothetical protein